jgi:hypothetical protein
MVARGSQFQLLFATQTDEPISMCGVLNEPTAASLVQSARLFKITRAKLDLRHHAPASGDRLRSAAHPRWLPFVPARRDADTESFIHLRCRFLRGSRQCVIPLGDSELLSSFSAERSC